VAENDVTAELRAIRERVRARYPQSSDAKVPLPDLMPLLHARDAALAKVASIGTVNPRPPGAVNNAIQALKRAVARTLRWFVRDQVEFNRGVMQCVESTLAALNECNRSLSLLYNQLEALERRAAPLEGQFDDIRKHWAQWRAEWERKLATNEVQFLRAVADLQGAFQHRVTLLESNFREMVAAQHRDFTGALDRSATEIQKRLWDDMARIREEYERLIHQELRVVRQRAAAAPAAAPPSPPAASRPLEPFDYLRFEDRFRGSFEQVKENQKFYLPYFQGASEVLDLGCGRGEFLALMKEAGLKARGVDSNPECVALCRAQGLDAIQADLFDFLAQLPELSLDAVFCAQVVEHLPMGALPALMTLLASRLRKGGLAVMETPNPECLAIFASHFYLDPTHVRPVPPHLLVFLLEESGFGRIEVIRRFPVEDRSLDELPAGFRTQFFGAQDYAVIARRL